MIPGVRRPCIDCGTLASGSRCAPCQTALEQRISAARGPRPHYAGNYAKRAKAVRESGEPCYLCGEHGTVDDPIQADHLVEGDPGSPLLPAHRSCNIRKSNQSRAKS